MELISDVERSIATAATLSLIGCGAAVSPGALVDAGADAPALAALHFEPGEYIEWEVRWMGVLVGQVQTVTGEEGLVGGRRALVVRSRASSDGALAVLRSGTLELTTWLDLEKHVALAQAASIEPIYDGEVLGVPMKAARWGKRRFESTLPRGRVAHSCHSVLGLLRGWRPEPGEGARIYLRGRGGLLRVDLVAGGEELVVNRLGPHEATRIDGTISHAGADRARHPAHGYPFTVWIDRSSHRVPVRIDVGTDVGTLRFDLVHYQRPAGG